MSMMWSRWSAIAMVFMMCGQSNAMDMDVDALTSLLSVNQQNPALPELVGANPEEIARSPLGARIVEEAGKCDWVIPETTYTRYRAFSKDGSRGPYEAPYFVKRKRLSLAVMKAWFGGPNAPMDHVNDLIWSICEETNWVVPAHEIRRIDLFAAETAAVLAHVDLLLGERLPAEIRARIRAEVEKRVFTPYLSDPNGDWWGDGHNNWTGVCAGSIGEAFLLLEPNPARQAAAIHTILQQLGRYLDKAFTDDGASLEGVGYWAYGLIHYVVFADMLKARTGGAVDLLADPKIARIAAFPLAMALDRDSCASFADSEGALQLPPFLTVRLGDVGQAPSLRAFASGDPTWLVDTLLRDLLLWDGASDVPFTIEDTWLPTAQVARKVRTTSGLPLVLVAKAGHNAEPHNNNDVGSFILHIGATDYLCDPGRGLYSRDYFGKKRYENLFTSARGHSLPVIGGHIQNHGRRYEGAMRLDGQDTMVITFEKTYDLPNLTSAERRITADGDGSVTLVDRFIFNSSPEHVRETFMTWLPVTVEGGIARITGPEGVLVIQMDGTAAFQTESLEEECRANKINGVLTRIVADMPVADEVTARFVMRFEPASGTITEQ